MKQKYFFLLVCLSVLLTNQISLGQSFSHKNDVTVNRTRSSSDYKTTIKFADLFNYPDSYSTKAHLSDSSNVNITFTSTNNDNLYFYDYYYSSYNGQYFYYMVPAGTYGNDTLTISITYGGTTTQSLLIVITNPIVCKNDSYTIGIGDTTVLNITNNDSPSAYYDKTTLEILEDATSGVTNITEDFNIQYINNPETSNYSVDNIVYRMADNEGNYDTATVTISVHMDSYATKVFDFLPAPGQFVNTSWAMASSAENIVGSTSSGVSLGGFGGYIIAGFDQPIVNRPENPYGVDFSVKGNAFSGWAEPAAVMVMKDLNKNGLPDDSAWYELAGSEYYFNTSIKNLTMTYYNPKYNGRYTIPYSTNKGFNGAMRTNSFHSQSYYPDPYDFGISNDSVSYTGTLTKFLLDKSTANYVTAKRLPVFGYADNKPNGSTTTEPNNPYTDSKGNGFDLEWAVDAEGNHVELDTIDFVKVYSTVQEDGGWLGEVSPEIFEIGITTPDPTYVPKDYYVHAIGAGQLQVLKGSTFQYEGLLFKNGIPQESPATWTTTVDSVGTIDNTGLFTANKTGSTTLTFLANPTVDSASISIDIVELTSIYIELEGNTTSPDSTTVIKGETIYIEAQAIDSRSSSSHFVYEDYNWTSSNTEVGTINNGLFYAKDIGRTIVYATSVHNPDLTDSILVIVNNAPDIEPLNDTISLAYYEREGTFTNADLFTTGVDATVLIESVDYPASLITSNIENNEFRYAVKENAYGYETIKFAVEAFGGKDTISITFHAVEPDNFASPKQIMFTNGGEFGNPNAPTELMSYIPSLDTTIQVDNYLAGATSVQDMIVDGNFVYVSADYYITRYNASTLTATDSIYTQDLSSTEADGLGTEMAGVNHKMAIYQNMLLATRQNSASAPEDGYNVRVYNKGDLSLITKISVSNQATDIVIISDTAYVMINGGFAGTNSSMAIIDLSSLQLVREVDMETTGLGVMQMIVKGTDIYCVRLADYMARYTSGIVVYNTLTSTFSEYEYTAGISYDSSPLAIEPMTNDTLFVKKDLGYVVFNTDTKTFGEDKFFSIPSYYTQDLDHIGKGSLYDSEDDHYYVAYAYWHGQGVGQIYDSKFDSVGVFSGVGASPEVIKLVNASEINEKPYLNTSYSKSYNEDQSFSFSISTSTFKDKEDNNATTYMYNPLQYDWVSYNSSTRKFSGQYTGEILADTTFNLLVQGFDKLGAFVVDTVKITIKPVDDAMVFGDSIADITVVEDAPDSLIDLTKTFVDVDNEISFSIDSVSNDTLIGLNFEGDMLCISFMKNASGEATVILKAESNGVELTDTFKVTVIAVDDAPVLISELPVISGYEGKTKPDINLDAYFDDVDNDDSITYAVASISADSVASASLDGSLLTINLGKTGQTNLYVSATSNGQTATEKIIVGVYPKITGNYEVSDFENQDLTTESYWNGSDGSAEFTSGIAQFNNYYNADWAYWSGWSYSNMSDVTTTGYANQYSAITGEGFDTIASDGNIYAIGTNAKPVTFTDGSAHNVKGIYVTNSTYAALSMEQGDAFAKKFGGEDGTDPDYFKLSIWGMKNGNETDTIDFYLADFRFEDDAKDYIIKTWQWVELSSLGNVDSLIFGMSSSDVGDWGINTPLYFAADNFCIFPDSAPVVKIALADITVPETKTDSVISLSGTFTDPDNNNNDITVSVTGNTNSSIVSANISDNELILTFTGATGDAEIVIEAMSNNKSVTDTFTVTVTPVTGTKNLPTAEVVLYPNPSNGIFKITTETGDESSVRVYSISGELIYINEHYFDNDRIDISNRPSGLYLIRVNQGKSVITKSIIKQ